MLEKNFALSARNQEFFQVINNTTCTSLENELTAIENGFEKFLDCLKSKKENDAAIYFIGNGGSAAVASHTITDFVNVCQLRALTLHDSSLITCMSNDYGYDQAFKRILHTVFKKQDLLIAISSSGKSANICNAAKTAKQLGGQVVTLTGFHHDNPLRKLGDLNFWLDSTDYGLVEIGHLFLLHNIADRIACELKQMEEKMQANVSTLQI